MLAIVEYLWFTRDFLTEVLKMGGFWMGIENQG